MEKKLGILWVTQSCINMIPGFYSRAGNFSKWEEEKCKLEIETELNGYTNKQTNRKIKWWSVYYYKSRTEEKVVNLLWEIALISAYVVIRIILTRYKLRKKNRGLL